jgi:uncharacterized protein
MSRVVFDTNVLVSAILNPNSVPSFAWSFAMNKCAILASEVTVQELYNVLYRSKFDRFLSKERREIFLEAFDDKAKNIIITRAITICRDPKDNKFLELAASGGAHYLITGDKDLLELHPFEGTDVVTPLLFLQITQSLTTDLE